MFMPYIYDLMIDNEEMWICIPNNSAMLIADCSLMDC